MNAEDDNKPQPALRTKEVQFPTDDEFLQSVAEILTSGMPQKGAKYTLPESMMLELLRLTYSKGFTIGSEVPMQVAVDWIDDKVRDAYMQGFVDGKGTAERAQ